MTGMESNGGCSLRCSWQDTCPWGRVFLAEDRGLSLAEEHMTQAASSPESFETVQVTDGSGAPWIDLSTSCGVAALCLASNARVIEIHSLASPGPPLITVEGNKSEENDLFLLFLCHGGEQADAYLLPPGSGYRLKLFGRHPKSVVSVQCLCVVVQQPRSEPVPVDAVSIGDSKDDQIASLRLQVNQLSQQMCVGMEAILHRLQRVELRLDTVENTLESSVRHSPMVQKKEPQ